MMTASQTVDCFSWILGEDRKEDKGYAIRVLTWEGAFNCQAHGQNCHECFVCHGIDDGADDGLELPPSGNVSVDQVCNTCICEEAHCPSMVIVEH